MTSAFTRLHEAGLCDGEVLRAVDPLLDRLLNGKTSVEDAYLSEWTAGMRLVVQKGKDFGASRSCRTIVLTGATSVERATVAAALAADQDGSLAWIDHVDIDNFRYDDRCSVFEHRLEALRTMDVLVIRDWGSEHRRSLVDNVSRELTSIVEGRKDAGRLTLLTTDLTYADFCRHVGARLMSRFYQSTTIVDVGGARQINPKEGDWRS